MQRAHDHVVVPQTVVVVEVHVEKTVSVALQHGGRLGDVLPRNEGVTHINADPHVRQSGVQRHEQRVSHARLERVGAWFLWLVFQRVAQTGKPFGHFDQTLDHPLTLAQIVRLHGIIIPVLPEPEIDQTASHHLCQLTDHAGFFIGLTADGRTFRGEASSAPALLGEEIGNDGNTLQAMVGEKAFHHFDVVFGDVPCADQFEPLDAGDCRGLPDHFLLREFVLVAGRKEPVAGIAEIAEDDGVFVFHGWLGGW